MEPSYSAPDSNTWLLTDAECRERHAAAYKLAEASLTINSPLSLQDTLKVISEKVRAAIGAHQAMTTLVTGDDWTRAVTVTSLSNKYLAWHNAPQNFSVPSLFKLPVNSSKPVRFTHAELQAQPAWSEISLLDRPALRGWLAAPLVGRDGKNVGLIHVSDKLSGDFDAADEALLSQVAHVASIAIANARLFDIVRQGRTRMQLLSKQLLTVQEDERRNIASELHDEIGQLLTGVKLSIEMLPRLAPEESERKLREAQESLNDLIQRVREMSLNLRPSMLDDLGLVPALIWHFGRYTSQTGVRVNFKHSGVEGRRFSSEIEIGAYRIVQEALTNVARHAGVSEASVRLWADDNSLLVQIEDAGRGFDVSKLVAGLSSGVSGIRERAYMLGGMPTIESAPGKGARITAELPLQGVMERRAHERVHSAGR